MSGFKNFKMVAGTAKTSHMLLLFTSVVLISIGVYGTIVSKEYGCDEGINIKLYNDKNIIKDLFPPLPKECLSAIKSHDKDKIKQECTKAFNSSLFSCLKDIPDFNKQSQVNKLDKCLNDHGKGYVRCMEGGLFGLSIGSIVIGVLMLLLSGYLLFM